MAAFLFSRCKPPEHFILPLCARNKENSTQCQLLSAVLSGVSTSPDNKKRPREKALFEAVSGFRYSFEHVQYSRYGFACKWQTRANFVRFCANVVPI
jgi:hypothetical protein